MAKTAIFACKCEHEFQDKKYGPQRRVHNLTKTKAGGEAWRCTVCTNVIVAPEPKK